MVQEKRNVKKHNLVFYLRIYGKILAQDIKSKMSYRADFIISMFGMVTTTIAGALSCWLIFQNFTSINGWTYEEMIFFYGFSLLAATPAQCLFDNNWNLRIVVYNGDFIKYCFRPINLFFYYMSEVFDIKGLGQLGFGLFAVIYAWIKLQLPCHFYTVLLFLVFVLAASLFEIAFLNASAAVCFWVMNSFYALQLSSQLRDYAKYPITIFKPVLRALFTFVIPIAFMAYYPSQIFLRPDNVPVLVWFTPVLGIFFFYLSYRIWMKGAMAYNGTGN